MSQRMETILRVMNAGDGFTLISNKLCRDAKLSMGCKGMLLTILHLPTDWKFRVDWLKANFNIGRNEAYRLIDEAVEAGYCHREKVRDETTGRLTGVLEYTFSSDPDLLAARFPARRDAGVVNTEIPNSGKSVPISKEEKTTKNTQSACAREGSDGESPTEPVTHRDGILELHGEERERYLADFGGDEIQLRLALEQAAAYVQPHSSRPLLVQVRAQLARILSQRRDFARREEARQKARKGDEFQRQLNLGRTKSQAIRAKQAADAKADAAQRAPLWDDSRDEVETYRSNNPLWPAYLERLEAAGRHQQAEACRARGWVKEKTSIFTGRRAFA